MKQGITLEQLGEKLLRQKAAKVDLVADTRHLTVLTPRKEGTETPKAASAPVLILKGEGTEYTLGDHAQSQIADRLGIPFRVLKRFAADHPDLYDQTVNALFRREPQKRLIRCFDWDSQGLDGGTYCRAFLSDRYRRLDNDELAEAILPELTQIPDLQIVSANVTEHNLYIKATTPRIRGTVERPDKVGDVVQAGVIIKNSEVGSGALSVQPWIFTLECTNGMVAGKALRQHHLGRVLEAEEDSYDVFSDETRRKDDIAIFAKIKDATRYAVSEVAFQAIVASLNEAAGTTPMADPIEGVKRLTKKLDLNETEGKGVLTHLIKGGDLSLYGALNAVTRTAEDVESYDRATELEALGGDMLALSSAEWKALAAA